ncbi:MAG: MFS transporter [Acidimicrobiales bacterium]
MLRPRGALGAAAGSLLVIVPAVVFVDTVFFTAVTPLLPHYVHILGLSKTEAGLLVAAYPAGTLLGAIPGGLVASQFGVRRAVIAGLTLMSASTLVFGFASSAVLLDAARFVQGLGGACTWAGGLAWLAGAVPADKRARALGIAFGAAVVGALFGPVIGAIASRLGTGPTFAGATVAAASLIVASLTARAPGGRETQVLSKVLVALRDRSLLGGMWLTFLAGLAFGVVDVLAPLRLSHLGASAVVIGAAFLGAAALEAGLAPLAGRLADLRGRALPAQLCVASAIVVSVLLPFVVPDAALVALLVVGLPAFGVLFVPAAAMVSDGARRQDLHQGLGFGLSNLAWAGGQVIAAAGSGALAQATADVVPYGVLAAVCAATLLMITPRRRRLTNGSFGSLSSREDRTHCDSNAPTSC